MISSRFRLGLAGILLAASFLVPLPRGLAQSRGLAHDQMELSQKKRLEAEADRMGMTPTQLKAFDTMNLGIPLLYDSTRRVAVAWQQNADQSARAIRITPDAGGPETVAIDYRPGTSAGPGSVTYSSAASKQNANPRAAVWQDLNADGVFDVLVIPVKHNDLLNLDEGTYILLDAKWVAAVPVAAQTAPTMKVGDRSCHFDASSGKWK